MSAIVESLGIDRLSVDDRIVLVQEIWDSIAHEVQKAPLTDAEQQEVDRRLAAHQNAPDTAIPWEQVEADALARLRR